MCIRDSSAAAESSPCTAASLVMRIDRTFPRINNTAVAQRNTVLFFVEVGLVERLDVVILNRLLVKKAFDDTAFEEVLVNNLFNVFRFYAGIKAALRINDRCV